MKCYALMLLLLPVWCGAAIAPTLTLVETNGISITGKISLYTPKTKVIKIQVKNSSIQRPITAFTDESQEIIRHSLADKNFRSSSKLSVDFITRSRTISSNITGTITRGRNEESEGVIGSKNSLLRTYDITLTNKSPVPYKDLMIEYRIFYTHQLTENILGKYQLAGEEACETLDPKSPWQFKTTEILESVSYRSAPSIRWTGRPRSIVTQVGGVLLTIRKKNVLGEWIEEEVEEGDVPRKRDRSDYQKVYESL